MEQEHKTLEQFITSQIEGYKMYPSTKVWMNVQQNISNKTKPTAIALLALAILTLFTFNFTATKNNISNTIATNSISNITNQYATTIESNIGKNIAQNNYNTTVATSSKNVGINTANQNYTATQQLANANKIAKTKAAAVKNVSILQNTDNKNASAITEITTVMEPTVEVETGSKINTDFAKPIINTSDKSIESIEKEAVIENTKDNTEETLPEGKNTNTNTDFISEKVGELFTTTEPATTTNKTNRKSTLQMYVTPGISYRMLYDKRNNVNNIPFGTQNNNGTVNATVFHKPAMSIEAGAAWVKPVNNSLEFKAGVQVNYNSYKIKANYTNSQVAVIALSNNNGSNYQINSISNLSTAEGPYPTWVENTNVQLSIPIGLNFILKNNVRSKFGIASTIQPTAKLYSKAMLLSTDFKNYTSAPYLVRNFNVNTALEAFVAVKGKKLTYQFGPQLRYQIMSTYAKKYPFKENLFDYGFKIAVSNPF